MTSYVFHYDLEDPDCIKAAPRLAELHRKYEMPGTFFMLGTALERYGKELKAIFGDDPLFDIQSHTYSHLMLKDNRMHGPGVSLEELDRQMRLGMERVEQVFERKCTGIRSGCGFYRGLQGEPDRLRVIRDAGVEWLSSDLRGPVDSIPGGLVQAYTYRDDGIPGLIEIPGHGWHDLVLADFDEKLLRMPWPLGLQWGIPNRPPQTPQEELEVHRVWIQKTIELGLDFYSPVNHPHSVFHMSAECKTMELLMQYLAAEEIPVTTYTALYERYRDDPSSIPGLDAWTWEAEIDAVRGQEFRMLGVPTPSGA
jgi:peptidoglycan/xylan/chitin deacetylase (PgdA/CDA1 family)